MSEKSVLLREKLIEADTLLVLLLLLCALGSVVYGLSQIVLDLELGSLVLISLGALLLSWTFTRTRITGWYAGTLLSIIGVILILFWVGDLWTSFIRSISSLDDLLRQLVNASGGFSQNLDFDESPLLELKVRFDNLTLELSLWFRSLIVGRPVYNHTANVLLWSLAIWCVSAWAAWFQLRIKNSLIAVFPAGLLLAVSLGYTYGRTTALYPFIFAVLLLTAITFYLWSENSWITRNMDYPRQDRFGNVFITFCITIGFLIASAMVSQMSIGWVFGAIREFIDPQGEIFDPILDSLGLEGDSSNLGKIGSSVVGGLPRAHLIGSGPELSEQIVMYVRPDQDLSDGTLSIQAWQDLSIPLYWRGVTYDHYTGYGWESSGVVLQNYDAGESTDQQFGKNDRMLRQLIHFEQPNDLIYAAGELLSLNTDYTIAWRETEGTDNSLRIAGDIFAGSQDQLDYQVDSLVPVVSDEELMDVVNIYPTWVIERYLDLPQSVPQRVYDLAQTITRHSPTIFSKASALEAYLRTFKYELNLPAPPENRELSDYFLFELQKGYCDYFATAMVVMARAVGIPARIVVGYAQGDYDPNQHLYIVSEENAHSWVEIFFAEIGWIPFEPTPAQPAINRVGISNDLTFDEEPSRDVSVQDDPLRHLPGQWGFWFGSVLACLTLALVLWFVIDNIYLRLLSPAIMTTKLFNRLFRFGRLIGIPAKVGDTPYEFTALLSAQIGVISQYSRWDSQIRNAIDELKILSHYYVFSNFSPHLLSRDESKRILLLWKRLRGRLLMVTVINIWHRFKRWLFKDSAR